MSASDRDQDMREREQWRDLVEVAVPDRIAEAAMQRVVAIRARRRRWRRFGPSAVLTAGALATATAAATGVISFGEILGSTSHDTTPASGIRALVDALEQRSPRGAGQASRAGTITREGLNIDVALNDRQLCLAARGDTVAGQLSYAPPSSGQTRPLPRFSDVPRARDMRRRSIQVGCVDISRLDGELLAISGTDDRGSWIIALAPDQVRTVDATTGGRTVELTKSQNLAVGRSSSPFTRVRWRTANGKSRTSHINSK